MINKKTHFTNETVYKLIILMIGGLMVWNLFAAIVTLALLGLPPLIIQGGLMWLILTKNQYAKIAIIVWAAVFLITADSLPFFGALSEYLRGENVGVTLSNSHYVKSGIRVLLGIVTVIAINRTVKVITVPD